MGLWDRVVSMASPRVATENPPDGEIKSLENAVFPECLQRILRACRSETACCRGERRYAQLIESDHEYEREDQDSSEGDRCFLILTFHCFSVCRSIFQ